MNSFTSNHRTQLSFAVSSLKPAVLVFSSTYAPNLKSCGLGVSSDTCMRASTRVTFHGLRFYRFLTVDKRLSKFSAV